MKKQILILATGAAVVAATLLTGCQERLKAPTDKGVCFHIGHPKSGKPSFNPLADNVPSVEHCAVHLYNRRMELMLTGTAGSVTEGVYQGNFLFVDDRFVQMAPTYEGIRITLLVKTSDGRLVAPGTIVQEQPRERPEPVEIPDNLPQKPTGQ